VRRWRERGHLLARIDPLGRARPSARTSRSARRWASTRVADPAALRELRAGLERSWRGPIGVQFMHILDDTRAARGSSSVSSAAATTRVTRGSALPSSPACTNARVFETTIQKKFQGAKSFSLEGSEQLDARARELSRTLRRARHRGRDDRHGAPRPAQRARRTCRQSARARSSASSATSTRPSLRRPRRRQVPPGLEHGAHDALGRKLRVSLCYNPSHLEFVNRVALGARARAQERRGDPSGKRGLAVILPRRRGRSRAGHRAGDAQPDASRRLPHGGTLHVVVNNQSASPPIRTRPLDAYCTDVALMLQARSST
jgi:2-oxoglutarate dehydrogenase E1 component